MQGMNLWWWMFDLDNLQLITSRLIPGDISDSKSVILTEVPIPGLGYEPVMPSGMGNRKISFELPLIRRGVTGNVAMLQQFMALRNPATGGAIGFLRNVAGFLGTKQFQRAPKVLYCWGTGSIPLVWWVSKCDATHKQGWTNAYGAPQYSELQIELVLDEENILNQAESLVRMVAGMLGNVLPMADSAAAALNPSVTVPAGDGRHVVTYRRPHGGRPY